MSYTATRKRPTANGDSSGSDLYQEVTDKLLAKIAEGVAPWQSPYMAGGLPLSLSTRKAYRGVNTFILGLAAMDADYRSPYWGTFKAIKALGGCVRKGEHGTRVVLWRPIVKDDAETGKAKVVGRVLKFYTVFNAEQADGLGASFYGEVAPAFEPIDRAERVIAEYAARGPRLVSERQDLAYYAPGSDTVNLPKRENIAGTDEYYSTAFHELTHSTGHPTRLNREGIAELRPDHRGRLYAFEELVAEFGAAMLCGACAISSTLDNSAAYLAGWASYLTDNPKAAIQAAGQAQRAADMVLGVTWDDAAE